MIARFRPRGFVSPLAAILFALALPSCRGEDAPDAGITPSALIVPSRLEPGDQVLGMRIETMDARPESPDSSAWFGRVEFTGPVTLTGRYRPHPDAPDLADLCFYPDTASAAQLPRFPNDERISWFCFSNSEEARVALGEAATEGEATIVINEFTYLYQPTDSYNTARLQQVLQRR